MSTESDLARASTATVLIPGNYPDVLSGASGMLSWAKTLQEAADEFSKAGHR